MNSKKILLSMGVLIAGTAVGAPLTPDQALQRARQDGGARVAAKVNAEMKLAYTAKAVNGAAAAYVFNNPAAGYVILGADDVAYPVLGYSDSGRIDVDNMSPELRWWLEEYGRQIEWAVSHGAKASKAAPQADQPGWEAIPAMVKTKWNQDEPYNNQCPKSGAQTCYSGCVATSMAQVMKYHNYPQRGEGSISYVITINGQSRRLSMNLSKEDFDWDNMLNVYSKDGYNETQADAVAYLMKACGYSVNMNYGTNASGASGASIAPALITYFNYDPGVISRQRDIYSSSQWREMVYTNLKEVGPLVINGQAPDGGHSFVCDGYDGKGYFHINWGWGGISDGYFSLDALNPIAQGIGSYEGGYNSRQNAIFGIQPPTGKPVTPEQNQIMQYGTTVATIAGHTVTFGVEDYETLGWSTTQPNLKAKIGAIVEPIDGTAGKTVDVAGKLGSYDVVELEYVGSYYDASRTKVTVTLPDLADGTYKVSLASYDLNFEGATWLPVAVVWGYRNYFIMTVKDGIYTATNVPIATIKASDASLVSKLYAGKYVSMKAKFTNDSDIELVQGLSPRLCDANGNAVFMGESMVIALDAGASEEKEWRTRFVDSRGTASFVTQATDFKLRLYDTRSGMYYPGVELDVTMYPSSGTTRIIPTGMDIENASSYEDISINGREFKQVAQVADLNDMKVKYSFRVQSGYYDGIISAGISRMDPANPYGQLPIVDDIYQTTPYLESGVTFDDTFTTSFPEAEKGVLYFLNLRYTIGSRENDLGYITFMVAGTGVDGIVKDEAPVEYYNMLGVRIEKPVPGQTVIVKQGSKVSKMIFK